MLECYALLVRENLSREADNEFFSELYVEGVYATTEQAIAAREAVIEEYAKNKRHILPDLHWTLGKLYEADFLHDFGVTDYQGMTGYVPVMDDEGDVYNYLANIGFYIIKTDEHDKFRIEL